MKIIFTSKAGKEKRALEEILSILFQLDPSSKLEALAIKGGLSIVSSNVSKKDLFNLLTRFKRAYVKRIVPVDLITKDLSSILSLISEEHEKKSFAVRCSSRFGISSSEIERYVGKLLKDKGIKINLTNPDFIIAIEPIHDHFYVSLLSNKEYKLFLSKKSI